MRFIRHTATCASKPDKSGLLTGECDCKTAPLDEEAQEQLQILLDKLANDSSRAGEESEYFTLRLDELAALIAKEARVIRRRQKIKRRVNDADDDDDDDDDADVNNGAR